MYPRKTTINWQKCKFENRFVNKNLFEIFHTNKNEDINLWNNRKKIDFGTFRKQIYIKFVANYLFNFEVKQMFCVLKFTSNYNLLPHCLTLTEELTSEYYIVLFLPKIPKILHFYESLSCSVAFYFLVPFSSFKEAFTSAELRHSSRIWERTN